MEKRRSFLMKCIALPLLLAGTCGSKPHQKEQTDKNILPLKPDHKLKNALVLWFSQTGHTKRHAQLIAHVWKKKGLNVTAMDIRDFDRDTIPDFDLILMGTPVFYYDTPKYVKKWINTLPAISQIPVAAFVTYGGPLGDQHNAVCSILELLMSKGGVAVGLRTFMNMATYPLSWSNHAISKDILDNRHLPNEKTYALVRSYAESIIEQINLGYPIRVEKNFTLQRLSTLFTPVWWTKRLIKGECIDRKKCTQCGICEEKCPSNAIFPKTGQLIMERCVLCFGCINNCPAQAIIMEYKGRKLFGFWELLKRKHITIKEPKELCNLSMQKKKQVT
jgi:ferredoxin/flavodoxin